MYCVLSVKFLPEYIYIYYETLWYTYSHYSVADWANVLFPNMVGSPPLKDTSNLSWTSRSGKGVQHTLAFSAFALRNTPGEHKTIGARKPTRGLRRKPICRFSEIFLRRYDMGVEPLHWRYQEYLSKWSPKSSGVIKDGDLGNAR